MEEILEILKRIEKKLESPILETNGKGAVRKCDSLGRVTLPIAVRRNLDIEENTSLRIICIGDKIVIEKTE